MRKIANYENKIKPSYEETKKDPSKKVDGKKNDNIQPLNKK